MALFRIVGGAVAVGLVAWTMQAQEPVATPVPAPEQSAPVTVPAPAPAPSATPEQSAPAAGGSVPAKKGAVAVQLDGSTAAADGETVGDDGIFKVPVVLDKHGKPKKKKKEKPPKLVPVTIVNGTLTVDGVTGKATLNYDIPDLKFIYIWAPGIGTTVISDKPFPNATLQKGAFAENTLDVTVDDHKLEIYSDKPMFDKKKSKEVVKQMDRQPVAVWMAVDRDFVLPTRYPAMGYGTTWKPPYSWPGSKPVEKRTRGVVTPPPMPAGLRPVLVGAKPLDGKDPGAIITPETPGAPSSPGVAARAPEAAAVTETAAPTPVKTGQPEKADPQKPVANQ